MTNIATQGISLEQLKELIVELLNIKHLEPSEQDIIITRVSEILLKDATLAVMDLIPEADRDKIDELVEAGDDAGLQQLIKQHVPNIEEVVQTAARAGIEEYKRLLVEEMAKDAGNQASSAAPA